MSITFPEDPPPEPGFSQAQLRIRNAVQQHTNKFNLDQRKNILGYGKWSGTLSVNDIDSTQSRKWKAWISSLNGKRGTFKVGDPAYDSAQGDVSNTGSVRRVTDSRKIVIEGYSGDTTIFKVGDQIEINDELKIIVQDDVTTNSQGKSPVKILPPLGDTNVAGNTVTHDNPKGLFRLDSNNVMWSDRTTLTDIKFPIMEVRPK